MFVSSSPCACRSPVIRARGLVIDYGVLISPECFDVDAGRVAGHRREIPPGDEPTATPQRDQLADPVAIAGDRERLTVLDRVHDLLGSVTQVALGDLRLERVVHSSR